MKRILFLIVGLALFPLVGCGQSVVKRAVENVVKVAATNASTIGRKTAIEKVRENGETARLRAQKSVRNADALGGREVRRKIRMERLQDSLSRVRKQNIERAKSAKASKPSKKQAKATKMVKVSDENLLQRFLTYVKMESQSIDVPDPDAFPITEGQKVIASFVADEIKAMGGEGVEVTLSEDYYVYVKLPSNLPEPLRSTAPSILFSSHLDVSPECEGTGIEPQVHRNYAGGDIELSPGIVLSPSSPEGARLNELKGQTIITTNGKTLLGGDDKTGVAVIVTMLEELIRNPKILHPTIFLLFSENEDIGRAAQRFDPSVFNEMPDILLDVDGDNPTGFSVENFTASGQTFLFKGNSVHPSHAAELGYADALTASSYFIGCIPPSVHPSASTGKEGYLHCYACEHPLDSLGQPIKEDIIAKYRIRYFDRADGDTLRQYLVDAYEKTVAAYPFVKIIKSEEFKQYENVAYTMYEGTAGLIQRAAAKEGYNFTPRADRGGTTAAMLAATGALPGGACLFSGQMNPHSRFEWCCLEDMSKMVRVLENIIAESLHETKNTKK